MRIRIFFHQAMRTDSKILERERSLKSKNHLPMKSKDPDYSQDIGSTYCCSRLGKDVREFPNFDPSTLGTLHSSTL